MKVIYATVHIHINELHTQPSEVPLWEVPILQAVHQSGVNVVSQREVARAAPEAGDEFRRLANRYRNATNDDGSQGPLYVASVYGNFGVGTANLARAIAEATVHEAESLEDLIGDQGEGKVSSVGG